MWSGGRRLLPGSASRRIVPGFKAVFHVCIQTAAGRIAQLYGSCTDPADVVAAVVDAAGPGKGGAGFLPPAGIGPHRAEAVRQARGPAGMDGPAVAERSPRPAGRQTVPPQRGRTQGRGTPCRLRPAPAKLRCAGSRGSGWWCRPPGPGPRPGGPGRWRRCPFLRP